MTDLELVGLPEGGPTTVAKVKVQLSIKPDDDRHDAQLTMIVDAVNGMVRRWPVSTQAVDAAAWPAGIELGATMLGARLWRRKDSPAGVESFSQLGAAYVMRSDPDIAMALQLGSWQRPGIG